MVSLRVVVQRLCLRYWLSVTFRTLEFEVCRVNCWVWFDLSVYVCCSHSLWHPSWCRSFLCCVFLSIGVVRVSSCELLKRVVRSDTVLPYADLYVTQNTDDWLVTVRSRDPQVLPSLVATVRSRDSRSRW